MNEFFSKNPIIHQKKHILLILLVVATRDGFLSAQTRTTFRTLVFPREPPLGERRKSFKIDGIGVSRGGGDSKPGERFLKFSISFFTDCHHTFLGRRDTVNKYFSINHEPIIVE